MNREFWFNSKTHELSDNLGVIPSVTQSLAKAGLCDFSFVDEETRRHSMARGTSVHWMTALEDQGALDYRTVPKSMRGYRKAHNTWKKRSGFKPILIEQRIVHEALRFHGTPDRVGELPDGRIAVVDEKTGSIADWVRYQLAAYAVLAALFIPGLIVKYVVRIALRLSNDGTYNAKPFKSEQFDYDWAVFVKALKEGNNARGN